MVDNPELPPKRKRGNPNWTKGVSGNPGGSAKKTDDERAGELYLRERTAAAAQRLVQLQGSDDEKIALGAVTAHLKITLGTLERQAGPDGKAPVNPLTSLSLEELKANARFQLAKEAEAKKLPDPNPAK